MNTSCTKSAGSASLTGNWRAQKNRSGRYRSTNRSQASLSFGLRSFVSKVKEVASTSGHLPCVKAPLSRVLDGMQEEPFEVVILLRREFGFGSKQETTWN